VFTNKHGWDWKTYKPTGMNGCMQEDDGRVYESWVFDMQQASMTYFQMEDIMVNSEIQGELVGTSNIG
jgi:hypothetical protein